MELGSYQSAVAISESDSAVFAVTKALYIGGAGSGNLTVIMEDGRSCQFVGLTANTILPIRVTKFMATGSDVTGVVALY